MSWLFKLLYKSALQSVKAAALAEIGAIEVETDGTTIELAKASICRTIQSQRKVPGTLRGILCDGIKAISDATITGWLHKAEVAVTKW